MINRSAARKMQVTHNIVTDTEIRPGLGGIIVAGGRSSRMKGEMKSLLPFAGTPIIKRIATEMSQLCQSITVAAANEHQAEQYRRLGLSVAMDEAPDQGPLVAFYSALQQVEEELIWLSACDMPLATAQSAAWMLQQLTASGANAVIPEIGGKLHPLQALYRKEGVQQLASLIANGERRMGVMVRQLEPLIVTEQSFKAAGIDLNFVCNFNTPEEYEEVQYRFQISEEANEYG